MWGMVRGVCDYSSCEKRCLYMCAIMGVGVDVSD